MCLIGLAIAFDNLWLLMMLVPFALVIRYGLVAREEAYPEALEVIEQGLSAANHNSERIFEAELHRLRARTLLVWGARRTVRSMRTDQED
jgi:hypothetical protein